MRELCDEFLSQQLDRRRPLWEILVVPELEGGRAAVAGKVHHAMVDGIAAVELGMLLFDLSPRIERQSSNVGARAGDRRSARCGRRGRRHGRRPVPGRGTRSGIRPLPRPHREHRPDGPPRRPLAAEEALSPAPPSFLNRKLGPGRTLVTGDVSLTRLLSIRQRLGVKLNDVVLAIAAGALRRFAASVDEDSEALRAMVPVSVRREGDAGGNRITFAFVELPCDSPRPFAGSP